jgi:hypothetical protein
MKAIVWNSLAKPRHFDGSIDRFNILNVNVRFRKDLL